VHLVLAGTRGHESGKTLCGLPVRYPRPQRRFYESGCTTCVERALTSGAELVRDSENGWVSLRRFRASR
jgi:hypothetical protein